MAIDHPSRDGEGLWTGRQGFSVPFCRSSPLYTRESPASSETQSLRLQNGHMGAAGWAVAAGASKVAHLHQPPSPLLSE